ncbi:MAG TPA: hypothetical protein VKY92_21580 [Verrucomicrobiae bacterium]|nr:hypothetical protein [Verrucomicrobiae bacterium]
MKIYSSIVAPACLLSLMTALPLAAQPGALPSPNPASTPRVGQEAKEKAEDAALLQQLETDDSVPAPPKAKRPHTSEVFRGEGGQFAIGTAPGTVSYHVQNLMAGPVASPRALVVRTAEPEPKAQAALEEDLAVMSHIFDKALEDLPGGPGNARNVMGIDVLFAPGSAPMRSLYLDNYGAVFFLSVNFPLLAPSEARREQKPAADSAWEDARQELYGQHSNGGGLGEPGEEYSQEKVDKLKETLFETLKNATNIRGLKPEEFVTVWVAGGNNSRFSKVRVLKNNQPGNFTANVFPAELGPGRRTVMTIRALKSEIDALSKGAMSPEAFQKHARVTTYMGDSNGLSPDAIAMGRYGRVQTK